MPGERLYSLDDLAEIIDDMAFALDREDFPQAMKARAGLIRAWVQSAVDAQVTAAISSTVRTVAPGANVSFDPLSTAGTLFVSDRDAPGRWALVQYKVGVGAFARLLLYSESGPDAPDWNAGTGVPAVVADRIGVGAGLTGSITLVNGFASTVSLLVTPGRASILGQLTIANLDQVPVFAIEPASSVILEIAGQAYRADLSELGTWVARNVLTAAAMPTTGTYARGDFVSNSQPAIAGGAGSRYVVLGWKRLVDGTAHVAGVDWIESRALTGT